MNIGKGGAPPPHKARRGPAGDGPVERRNARGVRVHLLIGVRREHLGHGGLGLGLQCRVEPSSSPGATTRCSGCSTTCWAAG